MVDEDRMRLFTPRRLVLVSLVLVFGSLAVTAREAAAVDELRLAGMSLERLVKQGSQPRSTLYGEGLAGVAFDGYDEAIELLSPFIQDEWSALQKVCSDEEDLRAPLRAALLTKHRASLAALKRGAHSLEVRGPDDWEASLGGHVPSLMDARHVVNLAVLAAEEALAAGDDEAAVDALLDAAQFGADLMSGPSSIGEMIGCALIQIATQGALLRLGMVDALSAPQLERLAASLRTLDEQLQSRGPSPEAELAYFARSIYLASVDTKRFNPDFEFQSWKHGFSKSLACAAAFKEELRLTEAARGVEGLSWPEAQALFVTLGEDESDLGHQLAGKFRPMREVALRNNLAHLRLTRAVVEFRATGEAPHLADPFGNELRVTQSEGTLTFQSIGPDGKADVDRRKDLVARVALL